jgi:hypothetical protein
MGQRERGRGAARLSNMKAYFMSGIRSYFNPKRLDKLDPLLYL